MDVTREMSTDADFRAVLSELKNTIPSCHFLAIDGEFTGLLVGDKINAYDSPAKQFSKMRQESMEYLLIEFGLCVFHYNKEKNSFTHRGYNFYVFPRQFSQRSYDPQFRCSSSSLSFLISHGFDFNKLFKDGIHYTTDSQMEPLRANLEEKQKLRNIKSLLQTESIPIPDIHVPLIEDICHRDRIEKFLPIKEPKELQLDQYNGYIRKLLYQEVGKRFPHAYLETRTASDGNRTMFVMRSDGDENRKKLEDDKIDREINEVEEATGFCEVINLISLSRKLVVGHNMMLDLCHILHQFCDTLPFEYKRLLDTKYMASAPPLKDYISSSNLNKLYEILAKDPFSIPSADAENEYVGYSNDISKSKLHEAGYDAYITGLCFLGMANYLDCANRDHVFHVSFLKDWKTNDLVKLFSPFGSVQVCWLNDTSAYVALNRHDQAKLVQKTLTQSDSYTVIQYSIYQRHESSCQCGRTYGKAVLACINMTKSLTQLVVSSPTTTNLRKRRSLELQQSETHEKQLIALKKRSRSSGESSYSKRSIDPIPEEEEGEEEAIASTQYNEQHRTKASPPYGLTAKHRGA
uniref:Poly(A)-specific ribonuclease RNA-binding domain-containing protein n=1 Tax=Timema poppense TaxID=170557 RepID=A0A7R9CT39_TIMPO|nr:unnamed protein product [Timema poppensis]